MHGISEGTVFPNMVIFEENYFLRAHTKSHISHVRRPHIKITFCAHESIYCEARCPHISGA